ncbi:SH3 domain-containing protein [Oricola cellulosilytica]|uniref:Uncharacterized protein n=1 Tax=Oricola cellulosilytica TaxID=1429082 RepID=A0A4R0PHY5_9HYPH|nr:SH3 domain-containing protein [Oricola cellulosilytica]TCD16170.1 hypothetical protein E0D97_01665 [Oricola cellulosilytica]
MLWLIFAVASFVLAFSVFRLIRVRARGGRWGAIILVIGLNAFTMIIIGFTFASRLGDPELTTALSYLHPSDNEGDHYWLSAERAETRTCPSLDCGVAGIVRFRDPVTVLDRSGEWVKIAENRKALCVNGRSRRIRVGNDVCEPSNGISQGRYSEWTLIKYLSRALPSSGSREIDEFEAIVAGSENFRLHRDAFAEAAMELVQRGFCTKAEISRQGGFSRAGGAADENIYLAYCGGDTMGDRVFADVKTKRGFR